MKLADALEKMPKNMDHIPHGDYSKLQLWCEMFLERIDIDAEMLTAIIWRVYLNSIPDDDRSLGVSGGFGEN